jgi:hypothetical protein
MIGVGSPDQWKMLNSGRVSIDTIRTSISLCSSVAPAEEWQKWLLIYSPALLYGYLKADAFQFYLSLVTAIQILMVPFTEQQLNRGKYESYISQSLLI